MIDADVMDGKQVAVTEDEDAGLAVLFAGAEKMEVAEGNPGDLGGISENAEEVDIFFGLQDRAFHAAAEDDTPGGAFEVDAMLVFDFDGGIQEVVSGGKVDFPAGDRKGVDGGLDDGGGVVAVGEDIVSSSRNGEGFAGGIGMYNVVGGKGWNY